MKIHLTFFLIVFSSLIFAQSRITGNWMGTLKVSGMEVSLIVKVKEEDGKLISTMDSPDQGAKDIKVSKTLFINDSACFAITGMGKYLGKIQTGDSLLKGKWIQGGKEYNLDLKKVENIPVLKRPQEPKGPFNYDIRDLTFENKEDKITLAGTLTIPKNAANVPVVILITGSGPQNRDEEIMGHKPFWVIADYLTKNGIAVLRYDDRGIGKSTGNFGNSTSEDFARDVNAAVDFLKTVPGIDLKKIGLAGHSEGGLIAPMVAVKNKDVAFIILLAGPGLTGEEILLLQAALIARADSTPEDEIKRSVEMNKKIYEIVKKNKDNTDAAKKIREYFEEVKKNLSKEEKDALTMMVVEGSIRQVLTPWFRYFLTYDPRRILKKVSCPVLAVNGGKDLQVPPEEDLKSIAECLKKGKCKVHKEIEFPGLNHLFQHCTTGSVSEYSKIEETFAPEVLEEMKNWIFGLFQNK